MKKYFGFILLILLVQACNLSEFEVSEEDRTDLNSLIADSVVFDATPIDAYIYFHASDALIASGKSVTGVGLVRNGVLMLNATGSYSGGRMKDPSPVPGQTYTYTVVPFFGTDRGIDSNPLVFTVPL